MNEEDKNTRALNSKDSPFYFDKWRHKPGRSQSFSTKLIQNIQSGLKKNSNEAYGKESGETLSLTVEPNWGPPLRYDIRNSTGYPFNLRGTIPRSLKVNAANPIARSKSIRQHLDL